MTNQPQPTDGVGWRQLLELSEQLMAAPTLAAQCDLIIATAARLLQCTAKLWLAEDFQRLPSLVELPSFPAVPPSELMRLAFETRQLAHTEADRRQRQPSILAVPLLFNNDPLGVLHVERQEGPFFRRPEIDLLNGLALQSAIALRATLQVEVERWRVKQLALVHKVSAQAADVLDLDDLFPRVADIILNTFNYYYVALFTLEPNQEALRFRAGAGPNDDETQGESYHGAKLAVRLGEGIIGHVAYTGEEILANDVGREPRYRHEDALPETRSEVALPLKVENRILGVLDVQSDLLDDFDETDMLVLRALSHNIAVAVEDARLYGDLRHRAEQLSAVAEVSRAVASILDLDVLLNEVASRIHQRFGYPCVQLFTVHPVRRQIICQAVRGRRSQILRAEGLVCDLDDPEGIISWVARRGETVLINDVDNDPRHRLSEISPANTLAQLAVPLIFGGEVLGVLDLQSDRRHAFGHDDRYLFEALADNVAIAIRNASLYRSERWRRRVADSLREVAGVLSADLALNQVLDSILAELERTLPCDVAAIWLLEDRGFSEPLGRVDKAGLESQVGHLRLAAVHGCSADEASHLRSLQPEITKWLDQAMQADQPTIRSPHSSIEPLGLALGLPSDYSAIAAPMRAGEQRLGLLVLAHRAAGRYGSESQAMTAAFASYAAVAIENARLYEAAQEQAWISTVLLQVAEATRSLTTLDQVLETVVRLLPMLLGAERCALLLSPGEGEPGDDTDKLFVPVIAYGFSASQHAFFEQWHVASGEVPALDHLRLIKSPIVIQDATGDARMSLRVASAMGFESLVILPLLTRGEVLGAMLVDYRGDWLESEEERLALMQGIAHQTATAIENARLLESRQAEAYVSAALLQVAQAVVSFNSLDDVLSTVARITPMLVGVEWCLIYLWEAGRSVFRLAQGYGIPLEGARGNTHTSLLARPYAPGDFPLLDAIRESNDAIVVDSFYEWDDLARIGFADDFVAHMHSEIEPRASHAPESEAHSLVAVPLSVKGDLLGVMLLEERALATRLRGRRVEIITGIAQQAALAVQNDLLQQEVTERERLERELQLAHEIQETFMPTRLPNLPGWDMAFLWRAARQVAGDFYDFFELPGRRLGLVIADVADKGMPAALFMTLTRTLVRAAAVEYESPAAVLTRVNNLLVADAQQGMFVTAVYAVLALETGQISYANAGHPPPLLSRFPSRTLEGLGKGGMALGVVEGIEFLEQVVTLDPGDHLVFYTDGITEAFSPVGEIYGEERLAAAIQVAYDGSAQAVSDAIDSSVANFVGDESPTDDVTLMVLRRLAS